MPAEREEATRVNAWLYAKDVEEMKAIASTSLAGWHPVLRRVVRLGLETMRRRKVR